MPSWLLPKAIALTSITTAAGDYQVTLHSPSELGGQEVGFSVAVR